MQEIFKRREKKYLITKEQFFLLEGTLLPSHEARQARKLLGAEFVL